MGKRLIKVLMFLVSFAYGQTTRLPLMESFYGSTSTNATVGNGHLTVGISKYGELVNLRWPNASYFDQLNYKTLYKLPTGWKVEDYNRFYNASERQGSFAGLKFARNGKTEVTWLRTEAWQQMQKYYSVDAPIVITQFTNEELGLKVTCTDLVSTSNDVLHRRFKFEKTKETGITSLQFIYAANLAPCNKKPLFEPTADWYKDYKNGFATVYDKKQDVFISFLPSQEDKSKLPNVAASEQEVENFITNLESLYPSSFQKGSSLLVAKDIYCIVGANRKMVSRSLYEEGTKPKFLPDVTMPNNHLLAKGPALCLSYYDLNLQASVSDELSILFSLAPTLSGAIENLNSEKNNYESVLNRSDNYWTNKLASATLPKVPDVKMLHTLKRALINVLITAANEEGGIGSSTSATQPPYTLIWPRDAAVMGYMLDCAGFHEEAEKNSLFFAKTQRKVDGQDCYKPKKAECYRGTWFQCFYADGSPAWIHDLEIDEVGWGLWMWYSHSLFLEGNKKVSYLAALKENIKLAADFLVVYKDPKNNLQKRAKEDDLLWKSQTVIGAATTIMGLKSAISCLKIIEPTSVDIGIYQVRLKELEAATLKEFWKEKTQQFQRAVYGNFGPRGIIIWPAMYLPITDSKMDNHAEALYKQLEPFFKKTDKARNKEWWYIGKATMAMAYTWQDNPEKLELVKTNIKQLLTEVCTQDTWVFGETPLVRDVLVNENGVEVKKRIYDNRVGQPCNIAVAYMYLTAELLYGTNAGKLKYEN
jgi:GH15 family glucan-1,4-alpha-glucosidase